MGNKKTGFVAAVCLAGALWVQPATATGYEIDTAHSFVQWRIPYLSFSTIVGRFNKLEGTFDWDNANPEKSTIEAVVDTASVDTNHPKRDEHLRGKDLLNVEEHPQAIFKGSRYTGNADRGKMEGTLTLNGVTRPIVLDIERTGEGTMPMAEELHLVGFIARTSISRETFGYVDKLPPSVKIADQVDFELFVQGMRKASK